MLLTFELPAIKQTATILCLQDIKKDETKENIASAIIDFLQAPTGKTFEEVQKDEPEEEEQEEEASAEGKNKMMMMVLLMDLKFVLYFRRGGGRRNKANEEEGTRWC